MVTSRLSAVTLLCLVVGLLVQTAHGQMVDCTIQVHTEAIPNTNRDLLRDIASDLRDYVSNYNWEAATPTRRYAVRSTFSSRA